MPATIELDVAEYKSVGPYTDVYGHGPVTVIGPADGAGNELSICLDCGFTTDDIRLLAHQECNREHNGIEQTWRERLGTTLETGDPFPTASEDEDWPIE